MNDIKLGQIPTIEQSRDAIHIAVIPIVAAETLSPGEHVGLTIDEEATAFSAEEHIGIVDPFLKSLVKKGELFYLLLYQGSITSLRHDWSHPSFANTKYVEEAEINNKEKIRNSMTWVETYAKSIGLTYEKLISGAHNYIDTGEPTLGGESYEEQGRLEGVSTNEEFWTHFKVITGKSGSGNFFTCSC